MVSLLLEISPCSIVLTPCDCRFPIDFVPVDPKRYGRRIEIRPSRHALALQSAMGVTVHHIAQRPTVPTVHNPMTLPPSMRSLLSLLASAGGALYLPASVCFALFGAGKSKKPPAAGWLTRGSDATISAAMLPPLQLQAKK
ncbi:MAG: hypothetical protein ACOY3L_10025 [Pseudomonadota bacterium]